MKVSLSRRLTAEYLGSLVLVVAAISPIILGCHPLRPRPRDLLDISCETRVIHVPFEAPPRLATAVRDGGETLTHYRRVSDEIRKFIEGLPEILKEKDEEA